MFVCTEISPVVYVKILYHIPSRKSTQIDIFPNKCKKSTDRTRTDYPTADDTIFLSYTIICTKNHSANRHFPVPGEYLNITLLPLFSWQVKRRIFTVQNLTRNLSSDFLTTVTQYSRHYGKSHLPPIRRIFQLCRFLGIR